MAKEKKLIYRAQEESSIVSEQGRIPRDNAEENVVEQRQQDSEDDSGGSRRIADETRNLQRAEECKKLKNKLVEEFTLLQQRWPPLGFISRSGDLIIYINYPANIVAKIALPSPRREFPMVVIYDQAFRRLIANGNSLFMQGFVRQYVV